MPGPNKPFDRAPTGVQKDKPVALRLLPCERAELMQIAAKENRSMSAQARIFYLRGLEQYRRKAKQSVSPAE